MSNVEFSMILEPFSCMNSAIVIADPNFEAKFPLNVEYFTLSSIEYLSEFKFASKISFSSTTPFDIDLLLINFELTIVTEEFIPSLGLNNTPAQFDSASLSSMVTLSRV